MARSDNNSATPWLAFLVGAVVVALIAVGVFAMNNTNRSQEIADLERLQQEARNIEQPDVNVFQPPDVNVNPPAIEGPEVALPDVEINTPAETEPTPAPEPAPATP